MGTLHQLKSDPQPRCRVLVVEDNLDSVHSLAMLIKTLGHEVQFAINGFAAIDIARSFRPDVILLDINLPDFKGYEVARQLRYEPGLEKTRLIAITGMPEAESRDQALASGCEAIYRKPLDPAILEALLDQGGKE